MIGTPDLDSPNRESVAAKPAFGVAGVGEGDVVGGGVVVVVKGFVASSLPSPSIF